MTVDWDNIDSSILPTIFQEMAEDVGMHVVRYLFEFWGGTVIYVPTMSRIERAYLHEQIRSKYNGQNEHELSKTFGVSRAIIRKAVRS